MLVVSKLYNVIQIHSEFLFTFLTLKLLQRIRGF